MITRPATRLLRASISSKGSVFIPIRQFSSTKSKKAENRIFNPVRLPDDLTSYIILSTTAQKPLITFWTASYCNTCKVVSPIINELIESGVGQEEGGVSFCEVEYDSPDIITSGFGLTYNISSMPTLLSFERGIPQTGARVTDAAKMKDKEWLSNWIREEARKSTGGGSSGGGLGSGIFGGLFGRK